ncbi:MAG: hypothetical protein HGA76_05005 [Candidatus Firestonebacteria bacterium]|nr:hypothetical protein [Candidatus Firestonebacteria bacterium]
MSCVKGTGVLTVYEYLRSLEGDQGMEKLKNALEPTDRDFYSRPLLPVSWVDFGYYMRMVVTADRVLGRGNFQVVKDAARYNMDKNFRGIYKVLISFSSVKFVFNNAKMVWRQWFDHGVLTPDWLGEKVGTLTLTDFPEMPLHHEHNLTASIGRIIELSGAKNVKCVHEKCLRKGDPGCQWHITWE